MENRLQFYLLRFFKSKYYLLVIIAMLASYYFSIVDRLGGSALDYYGLAGYINLFSIGVVENPIFLVLVPLFSGLSFLTRMSSAKDLGREETIAASLSGLLVFPISQIIFCISLFIFNPTNIPLEGGGVFAGIALQSSVLYILMIMLHSLLFGLSISLLTIGIYKTTNNKALSLVVVLIAYRMYNYFGYLPDGIVVLFPYDTTSVLPVKNYFDMAVMAIVGIILINISIKKYAKEKSSK